MGFQRDLQQLLKSRKECISLEVANAVFSLNSLTSSIVSEMMILSGSELSYAGDLLL